MSAKKTKKETFASYRAYRNLFNQEPRIVKSYLAPLGAILADPEKDQGAPQFQYYCKFSNLFVLKAFLCYLAGRQLPGLAKIADREESIELVIEHADAFKQFYNSNPKAVEEFPETETNQFIEKLKRKYLYLGQVKEAYNNVVKIERSTSKTALIVVKNGGNITLAALSRLPDKQEAKPEQGEIEQFEEKDEKKVPLVCRLVVWLWLLLLAGLFAYSLFLSYDNQTGTFPKIAGLVQMLNLLSQE